MTTKTRAPRPGYREHDHATWSGEVRTSTGGYSYPLVRDSRGVED